MKTIEFRINDAMMEHNHEVDKRMLSDTIKAIDSLLGDGYAKQNPELIGSMLLARTRRNSEVAKLLRDK